MEVKTELIRMLDYDLWANLKWFPLCTDDPMRAVMAHILRSQVVWLERCGGQASFDAADPYDLVDAIHEAWRSHLSKEDLRESITYRNSMGAKYTNTRGEIVRHMINHGTYHRGHLRAMAEVYEMESFPETDYILYLREEGN